MLGGARRRTLVIDGGALRNRFADHMHGVLGHDGNEPDRLLTTGRAEAERYGVEFRADWVTAVTDHGNTLQVTTSLGALTTRTILLATGTTDVLPDVPGLAERWGSSVLHCPYCHGWEVRDQRLGVRVTSPLHTHLDQMVRQWSTEVTVSTPSPELVDAEARAGLAARGVTVVDAGSTFEPHDSIITPITPLDLDRVDGPAGSLIAVQSDGATSDARVWAAGNVVDPMANVPASMGAGSTAGARINAALVQEDVAAALKAPGAPRDWHDSAPSEFWEQRYAGSQRSWSGRVNPTVAWAVDSLAAGRGGDLGCGEGADLLGATVTFEAADLATWEPNDRYDLVTAAVNPGGHLLLVTHAAPPPWADPEHVHRHTFLTAREEADTLALDATEWTEVRVDEVSRETTAPDGQPASLTDAVVLLRRR